MGLYNSTIGALRVTVSLNVIIFSIRLDILSQTNCLEDRYAGHNDTGNCRLQRGLGYLGIDFVGYGNILSKSCRPAISDALGRTISKCEQQFV